MKRKDIYIIFFSVITLFMINIILNGHFFHFPRVLYSDELEGFFVYEIDKSTSVWDKIWGNEVIRPIPRLIYLLIHMICKSNYNLINYILLFNNFFVSIIVFYISYKLQYGDNYLIKVNISLCAGILYIFSRFMQCQIFSILGIMEGLAHAFVLLFFYNLINYVKYQHKKNGIGALIMWIMATLCHERYILIGVVLAFCFMITQNKSLKNKIILCLSTIFGIIMYFLLRIIFLSGNAIRGTNESKITDNNFGKTLKNCIKQIAYIMGINAGPSSKNGIAYNEVPFIINLLIITNLLIIIMIVIFYFKTFKKNNRNFLGLKIVVIGLLLIVCCIVPASTSGEIALRFVYVSYSIYIILLSYMLSIVINEKKLHLFITILMSCYFLFTCTYEVFYRTKVENILSYKEKMFAESYYDVTYNLYGEQLLQDKIIILANDTYMTDGRCRWLLAPYIEEYDQLDFVLVNTIDEAEEVVAQSYKECIVILEDYANRKCYDVTLLFNR